MSDRVDENEVDVLLMTRFQTGDDTAFAELYQRHRTRVFHYCMRLLARQPAAAEEVAHDVFLRLYGARLRYRPSGRFTAYLYRIATRCCLNVRARKEAQFVHTAWIDSASDHAGSDPDHLWEEKQVRGRLTTALTGLSRRDAALLILCHYEGFTTQEAAPMVGLAPGAVKVALHRARQRFMKMFGEQLPTEGVHSHAV